MNIEQIRQYCLQKENVEEGLPFGPDTLVFKVSSKIFVLMNLHHIPIQINVKCMPEKAIELREQYECILPGYHMNKKHWNTIILEDYLTPEEIKEWIDDSYALVRKKQAKNKNK